MSALSSPPQAETDTRAATNIALRMLDTARRVADRPAIIWPRRGWPVPGRKYAHWTFARLAAEIELCAEQLSHFGLKPGTRTVVLVPPGPAFFAVMFAMFRINAVPVLIDPGMGRRWAAHCLAVARAEAFVGSPLAHVVRLLVPDAFRDIRIAVTLGRRWFWGGHRLRFRLHDTDTIHPAPPLGTVDDAAADETGDLAPNATAAILFTSGSTGPPKGVIYSHATFNAQVDLLESTFDLRPGQIDVATFPPFALFDAALGITAVIPRMDPTQPGFCNPRAIIDAVRDHAATNMFGSPALLDRVATYHQFFPSPLPTLRRVLTAGAPVRPDILTRFRAMLPDSAVIFTPYGATEALPVAAITDRDILRETARTTARGGGVCVGRPVEGADVRIIRIDDGPIATWSDALCLPAGEIGEIVVRGPMVTTAYHENQRGNELAKITDGPHVWHRMGDVGYFDEQGRLWMCGRKSHRVITPHGVLFTEPVEAIFNQHPAVRRTALVGVGDAPNQRPVLCVERRRRRQALAGWPFQSPPRERRQELAPTAVSTCDALSGTADTYSRVDDQISRSDADIRAELLLIARSNALTRHIDTILFHRRFPVDIRHNAKIFREQLAAWADRQLRRS